MDMLRTRKFFLVSIILFWIAGCSRTAATPTALPTETAAPLSQPTPFDQTQGRLAPAPSATATSATTPTLTPEPGLRTNGPYFSYFRQVDGVYQLVLMDADGGGRKVIQLPDGIPNDLLTAWLDMHYVSPDAKWLAFYTGSAGSSDQTAHGPFDLTLNILNLKTGEKQTVTKLLSKDYPNNFVEAVKELNNPDITFPEGLQQAFLYGIMQAIAWSPDSRYLAFAGQMDGLSSDLYVYDTNTRIIKRLTSGPEEMQWIDWSPDGKWILHGSLYYVGEGMIFDVYVAAADGSSVHSLSKSSLEGKPRDWLNSLTYLEYDTQNGPGSFGLRSINVDTGKITKFWGGSFGDYAVNKSNSLISIIANSPDNWESFTGDDPSFVGGLYLINLTTLEKSSVNIPDNTHFYTNLKAFGLGDQEFVMMDQTTLTPTFLSGNGNITETNLGNAMISVSPNSEYWIAVTDQETKIYSKENQFIKSIPLPLQYENITDMTWRPNSSGLFIFSYPKIYSLNIADGTVKLVESNFSSRFDSKFMWLNGQ